MNVCMVVCNNLTRDNRVLREAQTLQAAGHKVSVVGIATADTDRAFEVMQDGVRLFRVDWRSAAVRRVRIGAIPWLSLLALLLVVAVWAGAATLAPLAHALSSLVRNGLGEIARFSHAPPWKKLQLFVGCALSVGIIALLASGAFALRRVMRERTAATLNARNLLLRSSGAVSSQDSVESLSAAALMDPTMDSAGIDRLFGPAAGSPRAAFHAVCAFPGEGAPDGKALHRVGT